METRTITEQNLRYEYTVQLCENSIRNSSKHIGKYKHRQRPTPHTCTYTERDLEGQ